MHRSKMIKALLPLLGLLAANGCLTNVQQNLDFVLSPNALNNALRAPFSDVSDLALFFARFVLG